MNQHGEKGDGSRQEKHSQGKAGGSNPGGSDGESSEQRGAGREGVKLDCTHTDNSLFPLKKTQAINDWSKKLQATLKPFFLLWHEDVLS